jgi:putative tricarboxylic transport membrane protein
MASSNVGFDWLTDVSAGHCFRKASYDRYSNGGAARASPKHKSGKGSMFIRNQRAFASGALFVLVAAFFYIAALSYQPGTAARMGPGFFPRMMSIVLAAIGLFVMVRAVMTKAKIEPLERWDWKGLIWVTGSVALFAALLYPLGFVPSLLILIIVSSRASPEFTWPGALINAAVLIAVCVAVFVNALGLQFPVWPSFLLN